MRRFRARWVARILATAFAALSISNLSCGGGGAGIPSTEEVLRALLAAHDQSTMESAITQALNKTGLGRTITGSSYTELPVTPQEVSQWATLELTATNPAAWPSLKELHDSYVNHMPEPFYADFPTILAELQRQANGAFALTPDDPDSALLVLMLARAVPMPSTAPVLTPDTRLSPFQSLLYAAWIVRQFSAATRAGDGRASSWCLRWCKIKYDFAVAKCVSIAAVKIGAITIAVGLTISAVPATWSALAAILAKTTLGAAAILEIKAIFDAMLDCLHQAAVNYDACVAKCHQQGGVRSGPIVHTVPACCGG